jgi:hypothetical protein
MSLPTSFQWAVEVQATNIYYANFVVLGEPQYVYGSVVEENGTITAIASNPEWTKSWPGVPNIKQARQWVESRYPGCTIGPDVGAGGLGVSGRYVRIQLAAPGYLALAEVIVKSNPYGADIALNQPATQSSTYADAVAGRAVDGTFGRPTDGKYAEGSVSHTNFDDPAWWQVDLGSVVEIQEIIIWNRTDLGCGDQPGGQCGLRLSNFTVSISNNSDGSAPVWSSVQTTAPNPSVAIGVKTIVTDGVPAVMAELEWGA